MEITPTKTMLTEYVDLPSDSEEQQLITNSPRSQDELDEDSEIFEYDYEWSD